MTVVDIIITEVYQTGQCDTYCYGLHLSDRSVLHATVCIAPALLVPCTAEVYHRQFLAKIINISMCHVLPLHLDKQVTITVLFEAVSALVDNV